MRRLLTIQQAGAVSGNGSTPNTRRSGELNLAQQTVSKEDFESLLMDSFIDNEQLEGEVVKGTVVAIENYLAIIDVGIKTECRIAL